MENVDDKDIMEKFSKEYPDLHDEIFKLFNDQVVLIMRKTLDYGVENVTMGSNLESEDDRKLALKGVWFRLGDKMQRLKRLVVLDKESSTKDESIEDTYMDLINYGIISRLIKKGVWKK